MMTRRRKKGPPKPTQRYVNWAIMAYLNRYSGPRSHVRRMLWRKLERCLSEHGGDRGEDHEWIEQALAQAKQAGLINDLKYVQTKVRGYLRRGHSIRSITHKLRAKGISSDMVHQVVQVLEEEHGDPQWIAMAAYVRRVRMGPFRTKEGDPRELHRKDMARLGRSGYSFDMAQRTLQLDREEIEDIAFQRRFI